jgi:intracellular septation protein
VVAGTLNIIVAYRFDEATWVNFKLFGLMGLTLAFALLQGVWIARKTEASTTSGTR